MIRISVEGRPAPKGSRIARRTKDGRAYTYPASRFEAPWVATVAEATRLVMRHEETLEPPYALELHFRLKMPEKKNRGKMRAWPASRDLDKLERAVIDGLVKGKALVDDAHVIEIHSSKRWASDAETPGVEVMAQTLAPSEAIAA